MKMNTYTFCFSKGEITVRAFNYANACIMAEAQAVKNGWKGNWHSCYSDEVHKVIS